MVTQKNGGQKRLLSSVMDKGLCTGCGACVSLCPYMKNHNAQTVALFNCDRDEGRCYTYCPRTPTDQNDLCKNLFDPLDLTPALGAFKGLYMTRCADPEIREKSQHGGTVTSLVRLAMDQKMIEGCVLADQDENMLPKSFTAFNEKEVLLAAGSKFGNSPGVAEFNRVSKEKNADLGIVATPCQAQALAKMRTHPAKEDQERMGRLKLVIGLFCGWTLDWRDLNTLVKEAVGENKIIALDIPPSSHACMEVTTENNVIQIPLSKVDQCVRQCCDYCADMTAEFADISVGSARSPQGWEIDKGWNQVIVRSRAGETLLLLAKEKQILEFKEIPEGNLEKLKAVSLKKKEWSRAQLKKTAGDS